MLSNTPGDMFNFKDILANYTQGMPGAAQGAQLAELEDEDPMTFKSRLLSEAGKDSTAMPEGDFSAKAQAFRDQLGTGQPPNLGIRDEMKARWKQKAQGLKDKILSKVPPQYQEQARAKMEDFGAKAKERVQQFKANRAEGGGFGFFDKMQSHY